MNKPGDAPDTGSVVVEADGGSRGNPGPAGFGAVVRSAHTGDVLTERMGALGVATNNVAEYSGLIAGLKAAAELGAREVEVRMDSKLVIEQMAGRWQIKHPGLRPLAAEAAKLIQSFGAVRFVWIPRERNQDADRLANAAMDGASSADRPAPRPSWEPPAGVPMRMLLARHGATELTAQRRYSGRGDVPLAATGLAQAQALASRVVAVAPRLRAVVTSPLARSVQTAQAISDVATGVPVTVDDDLIECDFGAWEGLTFTEARERHPAELDAWLASSSVAPPGGESFRAVSMRVRRAVRRLLDAYAGEQIVVVSHVSPIKLILRDALGASDAFLHRCHLDPAGLSIVDTWPDGGVSVRAVNETAHLPRPS